MGCSQFHIDENYKYNLNGDFILTVGSIEARKNHEILYDAYLYLIERGVKNTQIKIAIKMLVRNNQTIEEISEIVGLDLNALRELKKSI